MTATRYLTAEELFGVDDLEERDVYVPQWKRHVRIRSLTDDQRARITNRAMLPTGDIDQSRLMRNLVIESLVQPALSPNDYDKLGKKNAMAVAAIFTAINDLNKLGEEAIEEAVESFPAQPGEATAL
jgi:hypothetical protein